MSEAISGGEQSLREKLEALVGAPVNDPRFEPDNCWGFVRHCYALADIYLPKKVTAARHMRRSVKEGERLQLLDVIEFENFFLEPRHVAVALDNVWFIQSSDVTNGVALLTIERFRSIIASVHRLK
jgi:cell wall-associated NlpC family hydrolase